MSDAQLEAFGQKAKEYNLDLKIETSSSAANAIDEAVHIALKHVLALFAFTLATKVICKMYLKSQS